VLGDDQAACGSPGPEAIAACSRLLEGSALSDSQRAQALLNRALAYTETDAVPKAVAMPKAIDDLKDAVKSFDEAIRREPGRAALFHGRAEANHVLQNVAQAIADYDEANRLDPMDFSAKTTAVELRAGIEAAMKDFGLTGRFAPDCGSPPGRDNAYMSFQRENGQLRRVLDAGPTVRPSSALILSAKRIDRDKIEVREQIESNVLDVVMVRQNGRIRSMISRLTVDGRLLIKDGIILATGKETVWASSCAELR
jgi:tetratricopeptide (TPR) repeat protein